MDNHQPVAEFFNLRNRIAVVTGGGIGIGKAIALRLAEAGAAVLIADRNEADSKQTAIEIQESGGKAATCLADVSSPADADRIAEEAVRCFGGLDLLVNNASIYPPSSILDVTDKDWSRILDINLKGVLFCSQAAARQMIKAGTSGRIINVASVNALRPSLALGHYSATKGGVISLTRALALELAPYRIQVNGVAPGIIKTPGLADMLSVLIPTGQTLDEKAPMFLPRVPVQRLGEPDDIAKVVLFLSSSASDYIVGEVVVVDGGWMLT